MSAIISHSVVDLEDEPLAPELAVVALVILADHCEGVHDVLDLVARETVEVEHRRVELGAQDLAPLRDPPERRPRIGFLIESEESFAYEAIRHDV